jgi:hypothetical protein
LVSSGSMPVLYCFVSVYFNVFLDDSLMFSQLRTGVNGPIFGYPFFFALFAGASPSFFRFVSNSLKMRLYSSAQLVGSTKP